MTDPVTEVKTVAADVKADVAKVPGFFAKQVAWVKANKILAAVYAAGALVALGVLRTIL
jgi:hypothetical protein